MEKSYLTTQEVRMKLLEMRGGDIAVEKYIAKHYGMFQPFYTILKKVFDYSLRQVALVLIFASLIIGGVFFGGSMYYIAVLCVLVLTFVTILFFDGPVRTVKKKVGFPDYYNARIFPEKALAQLKQDKEQAIQELERSGKTIIDDTPRGELDDELGALGIMASSYLETRANLDDQWLFFNSITTSDGGQYWTLPRNITS